MSSNETKVVMTKEIIDNIFNNMRESHKSYYAKKAEKERELEKEGIVFTPKQKTIINKFKGWSYGCQQKEVAELVSIICDIPIDLIYSGNSRSRSSSRGEFVKEYKGTFVKVLSGKNYEGKIPVGSIVFIATETSGSYTLSADNSFTSTLYDVTNMGKDSFVLASGDEIESFLEILRYTLKLPGKWQKFYDVMKIYYSPKK